MKLLRALNPSVVLVGLGLIAAAGYAAMVYLYPLTLVIGAARPFDLEQFSRGREWAAGVYVVALLAAFATFAASFFVVDRIRKPLPLVIGFGLLFALILFWIYPITAIDVFAYVLQGRMVALYDLNPMVSPASLAPPDSLLPFIGEWKDSASPYGPVWQLLTAGVIQLGFDGAFDGALAFKLLALLTYAAGILILLWGTDRNAKALLLFAWNPLVLLQGPAHAHNDLLMIVLGALALVLWDKRRWWWASVVLLTVAALIKLPVLLLGPLLLAAVLRCERTWRRRALIAVGALLLGLATVLIAYIPFWPPTESLAGLTQAFTTHRTYTLASLARLTLTRLDVPPPYDFNIPRLTGLLIFAISYFILLRRVWIGTMGMYTAGAWAFFLYLLTSTSYRIWYPLWMVPLAALAHTELHDALLLARLRWRTYLISLTSELSILMFTLVWRWLLNGTLLPKADWFWMHLLTTPWQYGLPLLLPLLIRRRPTTNPAQEV